MKTRSRIRRNMQPGLSRLGWRNNVRVVRITTPEVDLCKRLGIPVEAFAQELLRIKNK